MSEGWISVHRSLQSNWLWSDKPFSKGQAWIDVLLLANHQDNKFLLGNELVEVEQGSFITSELKLMDRWGWSKSKVRSFLKLLESDGMLVKKSDTKKTTLTVVNYKHYQDKETTERPQNNHEETAKKPPEDTNNNVNNDNNKYSAFFEEIWSKYPNKKGKGKVSTTKKKELYKLGDEIFRCIDRYINDTEKRRSNGFKDLQFQNGSTFFNSGYVDYMDSEYEQPKLKEVKPLTVKVVDL